MAPNFTGRSVTRWATCQRAAYSSGPRVSFSFTTRVDRLPALPTISCRAADRVATSSPASVAVAGRRRRDVRLDRRTRTAPTVRSKRLSPSVTISSPAASCWRCAGDRVKILFAEQRIAERGLERSASQLGQPERSRVGAGDGGRQNISRVTGSTVAPWVTDRLPTPATPHPRRSPLPRYPSPCVPRARLHRDVFRQKTAPVSHSAPDRHCRRRDRAAAIFSGQQASAGVPIRTAANRRGAGESFIRCRGDALQQPSAGGESSDIRASRSLAPWWPNAGGGSVRCFYAYDDLGEFAEQRPNRLAAIGGEFTGDQIDRLVPLVPS